MAYQVPIVELVTNWKYSPLIPCIRHTFTNTLNFVLMRQYLPCYSTIFGVGGAVNESVWQYYVVLNKN